MEKAVFLIEDIQVDSDKRSKTLFLKGAPNSLLAKFKEFKGSKRKLKEVLLEFNDELFLDSEVTIYREAFDGDVWAKIKANRVIANFVPGEFSPKEVSAIGREYKLYLLNCSRHVEYSHFFKLEEWLEETDLQTFEPRDFPQNTGTGDDVLDIFSFSVGQGNTTLVHEAGYQACKFLDFGGSPKHWKDIKSFFYLAKKIDPKLEVFITHFDEDHVRYLNKLDKKELKGLTVVGPLQVRTSPRMNRWVVSWLKNSVNLKLLANKKGDSVQASPSLRLKRVLTSSLGVSNNESGLAFSVEKRNFKCLFPGDARYKNVKDVFSLDDYNFLYVSHHGSKHSIPNVYYGNFPAIAIVSHGGHYGHPHPTSISDHKNNNWNPIDLTNSIFHFITIQGSNSFFECSV